ncbi:5'-3' exonuclease PLD3 isoform X3 [Etheostoma cragini]|uniref:5'-3' exonuclease PLD3 isoform X3 n=1 Tax=Etheostoma cragini TaxID=417921 RepID=UPI00155E2F5C|nr:5'-3' exonuclease PLD3 isoform X3 [Etheostoma cragini]
MPVVLRSRKPIPLSQAREESDSRELEFLDTTVKPRRRTTRLLRRTTYEESDESDSESVQVMETRQSPAAELEEETAEEAGATLTELKYCRVVLDRLRAEDKAVRKELEDKEDMSRKGGKLLSRIPTFRPRPRSDFEPPSSLSSTEGAAAAAPSPLIPASKSSSSSESSLNASTRPALRPEHGSQQHVGSEKAGSMEVTKSKLPDVRETSLPLPSVRIPKMDSEATSLLSSTERAAAAAPSPLITASKSSSSSESSLSVSPRPALRPEQGSQQHLLEHEEGNTLDIENEPFQDATITQLPCEDSISQMPPKDAEEYFAVEVKSRITLTAAGDTEDEAIMDEQPPWETGSTDPPDLKDSRSSSDVECEDDIADEKSDGNDSEERDKHHEPLISQSEFSDPAEETPNVDELTSLVAPEKPAGAQSTKSTKSSGGSSFALFCLLPTTLLLLGGLSQHVWHYGLPMSVAELTAQMELHWLEGFGLVPEPCSTDCRVRLVESIPEGLYQPSPSSRPSIADSWLHLLDKADSSVHIAAFYFTLRDRELSHSSDSQGRMVFEQLKQLESKGVELQIAVNAPQTSTQDTAELAATGAEVREVDLKAVTGGIVHTKLWVVDQKHFYLGSANMDWRSLSQVKEVGLSVEDCSCLAQDASRIFGVYWSIGGAKNASLPPYWPARLSALSSSQNPLRLKFNGVPAQVYLSSSPPQISARGRSDDLATILSVIDDAQKFIYISVMDYLPLSQYTEPLRFWPAIDSALRAAACARRVQVRLLVSCWKHSPAAMFPFLQSLLVLGRPQLRCDVDVKIFTVPSTAEQMKIPFARVNHAKYMVTDRVLYIGTSNWSENYFTQTAGVGLVVNQTGSEVKEGQETLQQQAEELFLRDWTSQYASALSADAVDVCPGGSHWGFVAP